MNVSDALSFMTILTDLTRIPKDSTGQSFSLTISVWYFDRKENHPDLPDIEIKRSMWVTAESESFEGYTWNEIIRSFLLKKKHIQPNQKSMEIDDESLQNI